MKAYSIARGNDDKTKVGMYAMNLGNVANDQADTKRARAYFTEAFALLDDQPQFQTLARIGIASADYRRVTRSSRAMPHWKCCSTRQISISTTPGFRCS